MHYEVLTGPPGCGKSSVMRKEAVQKPGLYLFAFPTKALADEQATAFRSEAPDLRVEVVHSKSVRGQTAKQLTEVARGLRQNQISHAVVLTTHRTLKSHDLIGFGEWHLRIDEIPNSVQAGLLRTRSISGWLARTCGLEPGGGSAWSYVTLFGAKAEWRSNKNDPGIGRFAEALNESHIARRVLVKTHEWEEIDPVAWVSFWDLSADLKVGSLTLAGANYFSSLGALIENRIGRPLVWTAREIPSERTQQPSIKIGYFVGRHEGSTSFWSKPEGRFVIKKICDWLGQSLPSESYWSGNTVVQHLMEHRLPGDLIPPLAAGLNAYRAKTTCAFIYSGKSTPDDEALIEIGITPDEIRNAREDEAIIQFVMRGAIRNPDFGGDYQAYVYDRGQAERLQRRLEEIGFSNVTTTPLPEAGVMDIEREGAEADVGEPDVDPAAKRRERDAERQRKKRAAIAISEGREPSVDGRPRKKRA